MSNDSMAKAFEKNQGKPLFEALEKYMKMSDGPTGALDDFDPLRGTGIEMDEFRDFADLIIEVGMLGNEPNVMTSQDLLTMVAATLGAASQYYGPRQ